MPKRVHVQDITGLKSGGCIGACDGEGQRARPSQDLDERQGRVSERSAMPTASEGPTSQ